MVVPHFLKAKPPATKKKRLHILDVRVGLDWLDGYAGVASMEVCEEPMVQLKWEHDYRVVSTHMKNMGENGNLPQGSG